MLTLIKRVFTLLIPFLWKGSSSRVATLTTLAIILVNTLAHTAAPWLLGQLLKYYNELELARVLLIVALLALCWCARIVLNQLREIVFFRVINQAIRDIRMQVIMHLHKVPLKSWEAYGVTEVISANTRVSMSIRHFMSISFVTIIPAIFKIGAFSVAMFHVNRCTWYFLPLVLLTYGPVYWGIRSFLQSRRNLWEATDKVMTAMDDSLHNTRFFRFHLETEQARLDQSFDTEAQGWLRNNFQQYSINVVQGTLFSVITGGLIVHLVLLLRAGQLTIPDFVIIEGYIFSVYNQMYMVTNRTRSLVSSVTDLKKVLDLLDLPTYQASQPLPAAQTTLTQTQPILQARNVSFAYEKHGPRVLQGLSLEVYKGDKLAITGVSGSGKSTLCHLLAGIYQPLQGEVLLYGIPMQQLSLSTIGYHVHFVAQEAIIITGSIADNLVADPQKALATPLAYLKDHMHQPTGNAGEKLSGGEKQRILIARCLAYKPAVLILDETLSALDEAGAQDLLKLVLKEIPTVILVTHRSSLVKGFTHIYHLKEGHLVVA